MKKPLVPPISSLYLTDTGDAFRILSQHQEIVDAVRIFHNQKTFDCILFVSHGNSIKSLINNRIFFDLSP